MQAIQTRYYGPTNTRGSRIKAWCAAGSVTIPYPHEQNGEQAAHRLAAVALAHKLEWVGKPYGELFGGCLPNGDYCFVFEKGKQ